MAAATTVAVPKPPVDPTAPDPNEPDPNALLADPNAGGVVAPTAPAYQATSAPSGLIGANSSAFSPTPTPFIGAPEDDPASKTPAPFTTGQGPGGPVTPPASDVLAPGTTPPTSSSAGSAPTTYAPSLQTVQPNQTVAGQVTDLLKADNPLMQTARNQAADAANARGLQNTSLGVQAGESAVIGAALPIASADAATYNRVGSENAAATNVAGQFNSNAANALQLQGLRGDQATQVADIEANYKTLLQTSASAASMFNTVTDAIGKLLDDPNTTADQKQAAVNNQIALLQAQLSVIGGIGNVDLGSLLDFSSLTGTTNTTGSTPVAPTPPPPAPAPPDYSYNPGVNS